MSPDPIVPPPEAHETPIVCPANPEGCALTTAPIPVLEGPPVAEVPSSFK